MSCSENNGRGENFAFVGAHSLYASVPHKQFFHTCLETDLSAALYYPVADVLDDTRKFVCSYMRMRIGQYCRACTMLAEDIEDALDAAAFLASGI